jgi:hypothetical protein
MSPLLWARKKGVLIALLVVVLDGDPVRLRHLFVRCDVSYYYRIKSTHPGQLHSLCAKAVAAIWTKSLAKWPVCGQP